MEKKIREILFRAKRKDNNEWIFGYYFKMLTIANEFAHYIVCVDDDNEIRFFEIDITTLCQNTEIKDKNLNMIFDNDIVKHDCFGNKAIVYGCEYLEQVTTAYWLSDTIVPLSSWQNKNNLHSLDCSNHECEVIGNIFDNAELLKENQK